MYEIFSALLYNYGVRPADVARATGIHPSVFTDWKKGKSSPKLDKMQKIADYFGVSVDFLMGKESARGVGSDLTGEEAELIMYFRTFNEAGRERALEAIKELLEIPRYTDKSKESSISGTA